MFQTTTSTPSQKGTSGDGGNGENPEKNMETSDVSNKPIWDNLNEQVKSIFMKFTPSQQAKMIETLSEISKKSVLPIHVVNSVSSDVTQETDNTNKRSHSQSLKRRRTDSDNESDEVRKSNTGKNQGKTYTPFPITISHNFPPKIVNDPKKLLDTIKECKKDVNIANISVLRSGDIKISGQTPHDTNKLKQPWPDHETYGKITSRLPKEHTIDQAVVIQRISPSITVLEIEGKLKESHMAPKSVYRFQMRDSLEPTNTVKVTLGSKNEKEKLISNGFFIYPQHFSVSEFKEPPTVPQCQKCQKFGHERRTCQQTEPTCIRCGQGHRLTECSAPRDTPSCANCKGNHVASYRGCKSYKDAVKDAVIAAKKEKAKETYVKKALPIVQHTPSIVSHLPSPSAFQDPIVVLSAFAECLSAMAQFTEDMIKGKEKTDSMTPFNNVCDVAKRYLKLDITPSSLVLRNVSDSPLKEPVNASFSIPTPNHETGIQGDESTFIPKTISDPYSS